MNIQNKYKISSIAITMFFLITVVVPVHNAELYEKPTYETENIGLTERTYTHTVFAEEASATWCQYCPTVVTIMHNIFQAGKDRRASLLNMFCNSVKGLFQCNHINVALRNVI